ncbi:hydrogenase-2 small chain [Escherichia coli]|nr:hydrogenase-2 small chain [Escherichia coli]
MLSAAFGHQVEENKHNALEKYKGQYVLVVDGSIPLKDNGIYCMVAGEPIVDHIRQSGGRRSSHYRYRFLLCVGRCLPQLELTQLAQSACKKFCQAKPLSIFRAARRTRTTSSRPLRTSSLTGKPPKLDDKNRPTFAYGRLIHEHCERRPHFDAGRFAKEFGDEGHREGWCLYHLGCKGPETYGNCSTLQFCDVGGVWPVAIGHPCYGCNEEGIGFHKGIHQLANVENQTPRSQKPDVNAKEGGNVSAGAIGLLGGVVGLVAGVSVMAVRELGRQQKKDNADSRENNREQT